MTQLANREPSLGTVIWTTVKIAVVGVGGYFGIRSLINHNASVQSSLLNQQATLNAPGFSPTLELPTATATASPSPEPSSTPETLKLPRLDQGEWPTTAKDFLAAVQVPEDQIPPEYKADPYYRPLQEGMITLEYDKNGNPTGGVQVLLERNAGDGDKFPFVVIRNSSGVMQYGYMHDPNLRQLAGFTADEVATLGIGNNHIGAGIPVTGDAPVAVEGLTFYPKVNNIDGSGNIHFIWTALGPDMQTMDQRLARSVGQSSIQENHTNPFLPLELVQGNVTVMINGSPVNFDGNDNLIFKVNKPHTLGGGLPSRITSFADLPKNAQAFQRNPNKGIRQTV